MSVPETKYLVTLCCSMDEVPVRLFDTEDEVKTFCRDALPIGPFDDRWTENHPAASAIRAYDCGDFSCIYGWNCFKIVGGIPVAKVILWDEPEYTAETPDGRRSAEGMETRIPDGPLFPV